ncbi:MAG TPA: metallophosphoesterase family protein [Eubacteriales bacterium]|nr:metallophosphoesterase family protein [Eubacteriales bacterium]
MTKIGIFSDTHGNFFALKAIYDEFTKQNCDEIIHTGDIISIGPMSAECLDFMFSHEITLINGNHDINYINDDVVPPMMSHVPSEHKRYVFDTLGETYRERMRYLPLIVKRNIFGHKFAFLHYGLAKNNIYKKHTFEQINPYPTIEFFDEMFYGIDADAVFFGHKHESIDLTGERVYCDVGSVGCHEKSEARGIILNVTQESFSYERIAVPYERDAVKKEIERRQIPCGKELFEFYFKENLNR